MLLFDIPISPVLLPMSHIIHGEARISSLAFMA
jgi:hypothetical protein